MNKCLSVIFIFLIAVGLVSCAPIKVTPVSTYGITGLKWASGQKRPKTQKTLLVSLPIASAAYQTNKMVYMNVPYRLLYYANNEWAAPPANMLLPLLAQSLRSKNYFKAVVTAPFAGMTNYRLDTDLLMLQQEFLRPISQLHLVMQATLINTTSNRVIASKRFSIVVNAPENDAYSGVLAANRAASTISQQISNFVIRKIGY